MHLRKRPVVAAVTVATTLAMALAGCGGDTSNDSGGREGGEITVLLGTTPDSLDTSIGNNVQSTSVNWLTHLGLLSYRHEPGPAGYELIPALAEEMPTVSDDDLEYTFTLRKGLTYSDGTEVKASDFVHTVERVFKLDWSGKAYLNAIEGAPEFDEGKADTISGLTVDDAAGTVTIKLSQPYGALTSVLGLPSLGFVPPLHADGG